MICKKKWVFIYPSKILYNLENNRVCTLMCVGGVVNSKCVNVPIVYLLNVAP